MQCMNCNMCTKFNVCVDYVSCNEPEQDSLPAEHSAGMYRCSVLGVSNNIYVLYWIYQIQCMCCTRCIKYNVRVVIYLLNTMYVLYYVYQIQCMCCAMCIKYNVCVVLDISNTMYVLY